MARQRRAGLLAQARHDVERPFGETHFGREFGKAQRRQAGVLRRLHHAGIAHGKRGRHRAAEHLSRIVPRDHVGGDAVGHVLGGDEIAGQERDRVAVHLVGRAAVIFEVAGGSDHVGPRLLHRLAGVARLQPSQFFGMVGDEDRKLRQQPAALRGAHPTPGAALGRRAGGFDGPVDILGIAGRDSGEDLAFGRGDYRNGLARGTRLPAVVDEDALCGARDDRLVHGSALLHAPLDRHLAL